MPKYLVLVPVGMLIDSTSPDAAASLAPSNISFAGIAQASLPVKGTPVVRSLDSAQQPAPPKYVRCPQRRR